VAEAAVPQVADPTATLTGWNLRRALYTAGDLCGLNGMFVPLPRTADQAEISGDPRPSLDTLYGDHAGYVAAVTTTVQEQQQQRLILPEDAQRAIEAAQASPMP
jgi:hypothetical protein